MAKKKNFNLNPTVYIEITQNGSQNWMYNKITFRKQYRQNPSGSESRSTGLKINPKPQSVRIVDKLYFIKIKMSVKDFLNDMER